MVYRIMLRLLVGVMVFFTLAPAAAAAPALTAEAAILVDRDTGQMIFGRHPDRRMNPASLTKIMTALLAVEEGNPADVVTVSRHAARVWEGQVIGLEPGDRLLLADLLRAALIYSANDSTVAIGEHIAGSEPLFLDLMNEKALLLGAAGTRYANTNGYTHPNHYTTARDLAVITRFALSRPLFAQTVRTPSAVLHWIGRSRQMEIHTTNRLLGSYAGLYGVKTGTTGAAGKCVVVAAERNGRRLIAVVLHSADRWGDAARLLDCGFYDTREVPVGTRGAIAALAPVAGGREYVVPLALGRDVVLSLLPEDIKEVRRSFHVTGTSQAPVREGAVLGEAVYSLRGRELTRAPLVAAQTVTRAGWWSRLRAG